MAVRPRQLVPSLRSRRTELSAVGAAVLSFGRSPVVKRARAIVGTAATVSTRLGAWSSKGTSPATTDRPPSRARVGTPFDSNTVMALVLTVAALAGIATVGVAVDLSGEAGGDGSGYTELSLLTEDENGSLVATDYPTEYRRGEGDTVYVSVGNREGETVEYALVVKLQRVDRPGDSTIVREQTELGQFRQRIRAGETHCFEHTVSPSIRETNFRLVYLLYKERPPGNPTTDNAYRSVYLRINVTSP